MARLFVTGLGGLLGGELGWRARAAGWSVEGVVGERELDIRDADRVRSAVGAAAPDVVVHTAYRQDDASVIVDGTRAVAQAAADVGARLVHLSTDLVFSGAQGRALTERDEPDPIVAYGAAKLAAERLCPPDALVVRTSLLYGGEALSRHERAILAAADGDSDMAFFTDEVRCPTAVGDLAAAVLELAAGTVAGPLHVAGPDAVSRHELACLVAARHGRDPGALRSRPADPGRPRHVELDSGVARGLLSSVCLRGVHEVLGR